MHLQSITELVVVIMLFLYSLLVKSSVVCVIGYFLGLMTSVDTGIIIIIFLFLFYLFFYFILLAPHLLIVEILVEYLPPREQNL